MTIPSITAGFDKTNLAFSRSSSIHRMASRHYESRPGLRTNTNVENVHTRRILDPQNIIPRHKIVHPRSFLPPPPRASGSPSRFLLFFVTDLCLFHSLKGLTPPPRRALCFGGDLICSSSLVGAPGELLMSTFLDLVARAVVGGLAGANLGALGVVTLTCI